MRIKFFILLCLLSTQVLSNPEIQNWQTNGGARVYFVETHELPIVDIRILFDAGSARDPDGKHGLALLTNSLLTQGAGGVDADGISFEFERHGAVISNDAGYDSASISLRSLADATILQTVLENLKRVISAPDFTEEALERQRKRQLIGIQHKQQSPDAMASDAFYHAVYDDHPYAFPNEGTAESVKLLQREDITGFYRQYYTARNTTIAIVGDLSKKEAKKLAKRLTADLERGRKAPPLPKVGQQKSDGEEVSIYHPSAQMHILIGQPGVKRGDPDYFPLYVGNHVLGGSGMVSRLYNEIREKRGLSYSVYSYFSPMREYGPFIAGLQTRADQAGEAMALLRENISRFIQEGPTPEELGASKKNITGGFPLRIDSNSKILGYIAVIGFYGLPLDYLDTFNAKVEAVTIEQVKDAFRRRITPERWTTILVGPVDSPREEQP